MNPNFTPKLPKEKLCKICKHIRTKRKSGICEECTKKIMGDTYRVRTY